MGKTSVAIYLLCITVSSSSTNAGHEGRSRRRREESRRGRSTHRSFAAVASQDTSPARGRGRALRPGGGFLPQESKESPIDLGSVSKHLRFVFRISRWALAHGSFAAYLPLEPDASASRLMFADKA